MKALFLILIASLSFSKQHSCFYSSDNSTLGDSIKSYKEFIVDDYPIPNINLITFAPYDIVKIGNLFSSDRVWFKNDTIKQAIVIDLYTDLHRLNIFNFYINNIPTEIINNIELTTEDGELATFLQKSKEIDGFLEQSFELETIYFTSNKGIRLGDLKEKILTIYSDPDSIYSNKDIEVYVWDFVGDALANQTQNLHNKLIAKESYGNTTKLYFKANKLIAVHIHNDIP